MIDSCLESHRASSFEAELPIPKMDRVPIAADSGRISKTARIALVTTGGIAPVDNPDRIQSPSAHAEADAILRRKTI